MSIKGFNVGSGVERYDYEYLDNKPSAVVTGVKGNAETAYNDGNVNITPANIGLGNVDNTSDLNKPISTAVQTALNGKQDTISAITNAQIDALFT